MNDSTWPVPGRPQPRSLRDGAAEAPGRVGRIELSFAVLTILLAPLNFLRLDAFYFTLSDAFALLAICGILANRALPLAPFGTATPLWNTGLLVLLVSLLLSSLVYGDVVRGYAVCSQYLFAYLLIGYVVLGRSWSQTVLLVKAFVVSVAAMCLHGIYVIHVVGEKYTTFVSGNGRLQGFVERSNECGMLIATAVPLLLWLAASGCIRAWWVWGALPLLTYAVMLTGSNTGLGGLVLAIAVFVVLRASWSRIALAGSTLAVLFVAAVELRDYLPAIFQRRVLTALESGNIEEAGTYEYRVKLVHEAFDLADRTMLLGFGADQYRLVSALRAPVHNVYLLIWVEAGLAGLLGFIVMLLAALLTGLLAFQSKQGRISAGCTMTVVFLFAILANAIPHIYGRFFVVPLLLGVAVSVAAVRLGPIPRAVARFGGLKAPTSAVSTRVQASAQRFGGRRPGQNAIKA